MFLQVAYKGTHNWFDFYFFAFVVCVKCSVQLAIPFLSKIFKALTSWLLHSILLDRWV